MQICKEQKCCNELLSNAIKSFETLCVVSMRSYIYTTLFVSGSGIYCNKINTFNSWSTKICNLLVICLTTSKQFGSYHISS